MSLPFGEDLKHLKEVSRVKHHILEKYLPPWAVILGSSHKKLCYMDCFAGPGRYESGGVPVDGSPLIAVRAASSFAAKNPTHELVLGLIENDAKQVSLLETHLQPLKPFPRNLKVSVIPEDFHSFVPDLLANVSSLAPTFFMIDPYWHPLAVPVINQILEHPKTEALINLMWFYI